MKKIIEKLNKELDQIDQRKKDLQKAIESIQRICDHKFEPHAFTHKEIEKCSECGMTVTL